MNAKDPFGFEHTNNEMRLRDEEAKTKVLLLQETEGAKSLIKKAILIRLYKWLKN